MWHQCNDPGGHPPFFLIPVKIVLMTTGIITIKPM